MALFTDGTAVGIDDLTQEDAGLLDVAVAEGINLTAKLALARGQVEIELHSLMQRSWRRFAFSTPSSRMDVGNVVVNPPLKLWQVYQALALVYRDCYFNQLNDRYQAKRDEFISLAGWAKDKLTEGGVDLVLDPVVQAGAPSVTSIAAAESGGTYYFSVSYVNAGGQEGQSSTVIAATTTDGNAADLTAGSPPANATGWNCYAGSTPDTLYLQNESPLDLGSDFAFYPSSALTAGATPGAGQMPDFHRALPKLLQRG